MNDLIPMLLMSMALTAAVPVRGAATGNNVPPSLRGDLKLEVVGQDDVTIGVVFTGFPRQRRSTPMTKKESNRSEAVSPVVVRTGDHAREAVITEAHDGIYSIIVEPADGGAKSFVGRLKIYEATGKAKTKPIIARRITAGTVVAKVLMPEGITWDDEAAFTGSMQDEGSVTKFNATTGLVWREYVK